MVTLCSQLNKVTSLPNPESVKTFNLELSAQLLAWRVSPGRVQIDKVLRVLMSFANPCEISVSIMGFLRVPGAQKPCQKIASCRPLCETRGLCCATSFVNIEMTGEMEPRRPSVTKVLDIFQMGPNMESLFVLFVWRICWRVNNVTHYNGQCASFLILFLAGPEFNHFSFCFTQYWFLNSFSTKVLLCPLLSCFFHLLLNIRHPRHHINWLAFDPFCSSSP